MTEKLLTGMLNHKTNILIKPFFCTLLVVDATQTSSVIIGINAGMTLYSVCGMVYDNMSRVVRKQDYWLCEIKGADQLRGNPEADQRLCFRYTDSTISLLLKSEISSF